MLHGFNHRWHYIFSTDGFIVQLPLPKHISADKIILSIDPKKDVDGFHPINVGRVSLGLPAYVSATPLGITKILERYNVATEGKHWVKFCIRHAYFSAAGS